MLSEVHSCLDALGALSIHFIGTEQYEQGWRFAENCRERPASLIGCELRSTLKRQLGIYVVWSEVAEGSRAPSQGIFHRAAKTHPAFRES